MTKTTIAKLSVLFATAVTAPAGDTPSAVHNQSASATTLQGRIERLAPLLGVWEIEDQWSNGQSLWARNEYRVGLGGRFVEVTTTARDGDGKPYERYRTVFAFDDAKERYVSYGFVYDGTAMIVPFDVAEESGRLTVKTAWTDGEGDAASDIKQVVTVIDDKSYRWQVWMRPKDGEWTELIDGQWRKTE